jgi:hypothetical protein
MSPTAGGRDGGGKVRSKRGGRRGRSGAHRGVGDNGAVTQRRRGGGSPVDRSRDEAEERDEGATECSGTCS